MKYVTKITPDSDESAHQKRLFEICALNQKLHPALGSPLLFACVNENKVRGVGGAITGANHKAMGKRAGVADVILLWPSPIVGKFFLCIEMKKPGGKQSPEQKVFEKAVNDVGGYYRLCFSWREAVETLSWYLGVEILILED